MKISAYQFPIVVAARAGTVRSIHASRRPATVLARLGLGFLLLLSLLLPAARGANTFLSAGNFGGARSQHTATLLPNGKVLVAGGGSFATAILFDQGSSIWVATGSLAAQRARHTATLLPDGKVLVVGGLGASSVKLASAEIYDPAAGTWSATGSLATARVFHTATLLPNGKVLVAGGQGAAGSLASAEIYDPATELWSATGSLSVARDSCASALLANGKVLFAGGQNGATALASAELYDAVSGTWSATGSLATARSLHTATVMTNGRVLAAAGQGSAGLLASAEIYDPLSGTWISTTLPEFLAGFGDLTVARAQHTASLLPNGTVLIAGGVGAAGALASAELYETENSSFDFTGPLATARSLHTATLLTNGKVLVAGGQGTAGNHNTAERYDSDNGRSQILNASRLEFLHTATMLPNGGVLVAGGFARLETGVDYIAEAVLYDPVQDTSRVTGSLATARARHAATLLANGRVLVAGGAGTGNVKLASAELYNPLTGLWTATGSLATARSQHTATLLPSGKVLVAGGLGASALATAELYDPATALWTPTGSLANARAQHTATLLQNGKVLVVGGLNGSALASAELYDPATGLWTATAALTTARSQHTATLLPSGKVLVAGGLGASALNTAQLFDPAGNAGAGSWTSGGTFATARYAHTATLLLNGTVYLAGGYNGSYLASAELFDPATVGTLWSTTGPLYGTRYQHTATLLSTGRVFVAGGDNGGSSSFPPWESYDLRAGFAGSIEAPFYDPQVQAWAAFDTNGRLVINGNRLRGISGGSGGNGAQDSATNFPVVQLRRLDNEQSVFLPPDPEGEVSSSTFISGVLPAFGAGHVMVTVFVNGIPTGAGIAASRAPGIVVEQPVNSAIADGGSRSFSATTATPGALTFTIKNPGFVNLTGLTITKDGTNAADFTVTVNPTAPVAPGGSTTFTIQFAPTTTGAKTAAIHIANSVAGMTPYDINFTGQLLSTTADTDGDGLKDAVEFDLAAQGFNWQVSQPALVTSYYASANGAGLYSLTQYNANRTAGHTDVTSAPNTYSLYTLAQVQALNVGVPLLTKDVATGKFKLTIGVTKSTNLATVPFTAFPMTGAGVTTTINAAGKLEFVFPVSDSAAFFRVQAQ